MKKLMLKTKLMNTKDELSKIIIDGNKTPEEIGVYKLWLEHVNSLIEVCVERNKF